MRHPIRMTAQEPPKKKPRPEDPNQRAASIVRESTAEDPPSHDEMRVAMRTLEERFRADTEALADLAVLRDWIEAEDGRHVTAASLGRKGGLKGGMVRAARLSPEERTEIAKKAAAARWKRSV